MISSGHPRHVLYVDRVPSTRDASTVLQVVSQLVHDVSAPLSLARPRSPPVTPRLVTPTSCPILAHPPFVLNSERICHRARTHPLGPIHASTKSSSLTTFLPPARPPRSSPMLVVVSLPTEMRPASTCRRSSSLSRTGQQTRRTRRGSSPRRQRRRSPCRATWPRTCANTSSTHG